VLKLSLPYVFVVQVVVQIHNSMNEATWRKVVEWEAAFHADEHGPEGPKLWRFTVWNCE
jgi:cytochrome c/c1 heme lyase